MLLSSTREWPWGLVVLGDPDDRGQLPTTLGEEVAVATAGTIACRIQHSVDGSATAAAFLDFADEPHGLLLAYEGRLELSSGRLRLGDAGNEVTEEVCVAPGRYGVYVFVDQPKHPTEVRFALTPQSGHVPTAAPRRDSAIASGHGRKPIAALLAHLP